MVVSATATLPSVTPAAGPRLEQVVRCCRTLNSILDADQLHDAICRQLQGVFDAQRVVLFLHEPARNQLVWNPPGKRAMRLEVDRSASGKVWQSRQSLLVRDSFAMDELLPEMASYHQFLPRSIMICPLVEGRDRCSGVIHVLDSRCDHFSQDDLQLLEAIVSQVGAIMQSAVALTAQRRQFASFVATVAKALDARDPSTHLHSINVANYCQGIAYYLGLDAREQEWLRIAGLLHDVGKIATPQAILSKPGPLSQAEQEEMRRHATFTGSILSQIEFIEEYKGMHHIVAAHHEKLDGSGYPWGLRAEQISLRTRIISVADIYDALTQDRSYRKGVSSEEALVMLDAMAPHQVDETCVEALRRFLGCASRLKCA